MTCLHTDNTIGLVETRPLPLRTIAACRRHVGAPAAFWREIGAMAFVVSLVLAVAHIGQPYSGLAFVVLLWGVFLVKATP